MNPVNPNALLHSKWTKVDVHNKEKHFVVIDVEKDENKKVIRCVIEAVINHKEYEINWRDLKKSTLWRQGWQ